MEFIGKTVEEAVNEGLEKLNLTKETAIIKVIEEPVKGLFGRLKGRAVVDIEELKNDVNYYAYNDGDFRVHVYCSIFYLHRFKFSNRNTNYPTYQFYC